jgi:type I restriction-modification system DNA methylase subunit
LNRHSRISTMPIRKDAGCSRELDYVEQTSWVLFLKYLDDLERERQILKGGDKGGIVIKNTFLSNTDNASVSLRRLLLESCNLHTVLDLPGGVFAGAGVETVVLFFEKGVPTRKVWYYQLDPGRNLGKTNPLNEADLAEFVTLQKACADSPKSWSVDASTIDPATRDFSVKNPNGGEAVAHRSPQEIVDDIAALDAESADVLAKIDRDRSLRSVRCCIGGPYLVAVLEARTLASLARL